MMYHRRSLAIALVFALTLLITPSYSDTIMGAKFGLNRNTTSSAHTNYYTRIAVGYFCKFTPHHQGNTAIQFEFLFSQKGSQGGELFLRQEYSDGYHDQWHSKRDYYDLNLLLKHNIAPWKAIHISPFIGPTYSFLQYAEERYRDFSEGTWRIAETKDSYSKWDFGMMFGMDMEYRTGELLLMCQASFYHGFRNIYRGTNYFATNTGFNISVGLGMTFIGK
jgi:hypothetical protein